MLVLNEASGWSRRLKICEGNLALLREKIGHDPESYGSEWAEHLVHFQAQMRLLQVQPQQQRWQLESLLSLTEFLGSTAQRFPEKSALFAQSVLDGLEGPQVAAMDPELRLALCKAAVRMTTIGGGGQKQKQQSKAQQKGSQPLELFRSVPLLFQLLQCPDKQLRKFILGSLVALIRRCTTKGGQQKGGGAGKKLKRRAAARRRRLATFGTQASARLQQLLFSQLQQESQPVCARVAQMALVDAYRKQYWRDAKTANALAECVFHRVQRIQVSTMRFFLGSSKDEQGEEEESSEDDGDQAKEDRTLKEVLQQFKHSKKTRKRQKQLSQAKKEIGREKKSKKEHGSRQCNLEAIRSIYDPQRFADRLFGQQLQGRKNEKYAIRLLQIALCARVIGVHRLQCLGFYSYLHRYLQPKQKEVTRLLLYAAQACHELVPPDVVEQLVHVIAQNFVSDRNTPEAITVGLNTIREIYTNCPAAANEDMVRDLAEYKTMHNKNVSMASRALIGHLRRVQPRLLHHKDRGRPPPKRTAAAEPLGVGNCDAATVDGSSLRAGKFGELKAFDHVPGADILPEDAAEAERMVAEMGSDDDDDDDGDEEGEGEEEEEDLVDSEEEVEDKEEENEHDEDEGMEEAEDANEEEDEEDNEEVVDEEEEEEWATDSSAMEDGEDEEEGDDDQEDDDEEEDQMTDDQMADDQQAAEVAEAKSGNELMTKSNNEKKQRLMNKPLRKSQRKAEALVEQKEALERAKTISESRILTDADFQLIRQRQLRQLAGLERGGGGRGVKRKQTNDEVRLEEQVQEKMARSKADGLPRLNDIEHFHKKVRRQTKEERMEQVREGREGRPEYGKPAKKGPHVGRTNRELAKRKNFQMVRQKVRGKNRQRSFRDRQMSLRKYLLRQQGKKV